MRPLRWLRLLLGALVVGFVALTALFPRGVTSSLWWEGALLVAPLYLIASVAYAVWSWRTRTPSTGKTRITPFIGLVIGVLFIVAKVATGPVSRALGMPVPVALGLSFAVLLIAAWPIVRAGYDPLVTFRRYAAQAVGSGLVLALFEHGDYWLALAIFVTMLTFGYLKNRARTSSA